MGPQSELAQGALVEALRLVLKRKKLTYADAAAALAVSEQTIKRFFAGEDFPVSRILALCDLAEISFFDLAAMARAEEAEVFFELSVEQEERFVAYPHLLVFFNELRGGKTPDELRAAHGLSARAVARYLKELEGMELLERLPGGKVRLTVDGSFNLRRNGPLSRWKSIDFATQLLGWIERNSEASASGAPGVESAWKMTDGLFSPATIAELKKDIEELSGRYRKIAQREEHLLTREQLRPAAFLLALGSPFEVEFREQIVEI